MKGLKISLALMTAALMTIGLASVASAFHSGGVAECEGCHSMHNSFENQPNVTNRAQFSSGPYLLKANDQSGACLNCHQSADTAPSGYHISTAGVTPYDSTTTPVESTPGGDFAWLKKTMNVVIRGTTALDGNLGERHGHNVIAVDFGYSPDSTLTTAPGGTYPASALGCQSCHDPHGKYRRFADGTVSTTGLPIFGSGSYTNSADPIAGVSARGVYRILGGVGYQPKSLSGSFAFTSPVYDAVVASSYNRSEATTQTAYALGRNSAEWCANCHSAMLMNGYTSGMAGLRHPAGNGAKLTADVANNYNTYVRSGVTSASANRFSTLAPFEIGVADSTPATYTALKAFAAAPTPADTTNNVSCLSCHRAHASGFESSLRWFYLNEFMTIADASNAAIYDSSTTENKINYGYSQTQQTNAYNYRPATTFGPYARSYCNKCHAKD